MVVALVYRKAEEELKWAKTLFQGLIEVLVRKLVGVVVGGAFAEEPVAELAGPAALAVEVEAPLGKSAVENSVAMAARNPVEDWAGTSENNLEDTAESQVEVFVDSSAQIAEFPFEVVARNSVGIPLVSQTYNFQAG